MPARRYSEADLRAMIPLYLDGALDDDERAAVEQYWAAHPEALSEFATSTRLIDLLDEAVTAPPLDADFTAEVMQRVSEVGPIRRWWERLGLTPPLTRLRWAVEFGLLVFMVALLAPHPWAPTICPTECWLFGDPQWVAGRPAAVRLIARDRRSGRPVVNADVTIRLQQQLRRWAVLRARTNDQGTLDADISAALDVEPGDYWLSADVQAATGRVRVWHPVTVARHRELLLEPLSSTVLAGDRVAARVVVRDAGSGRPYGGESVAWRLEDRRGAALAQGRTVVSAAGQAWLEVPLAAGLPAGEATLWATSGDALACAPVQVEPPCARDLQVEIRTPAVLSGGAPLPVQVRVLRPPAEEVPAARVTVTVRDGQQRVRQSGVADSTGQLAFTMSGWTPTGRTRLLVTADVVAPDGQRGRGYATVEHWPAPAVLLAVQEGSLVAGLDSRLRIEASRPDGSPAADAVEVATDDSDWAAVPLEHGRAHWVLRPALGPNRVRLRALVDGRTLVQESTVYAEAPEHALMVQPVRSPVAAGERLQVALATTAGAGDGYLDVVAGGQTVATRSISLRGGRASLVLRLPATVSGPVAIRAYALDARGVWRAGAARVDVASPPGPGMVLEPAARQPGQVVPRLTDTDGAARAGEVLLAAVRQRPVDRAVAAGAPADAGGSPAFGWQANSTLLARQEALAAQQRFFRRSPYYAVGVGALLLGALLLWLHQFLGDPFESVRRAECRAWGRVPQVHRRGAWAGYGAVALALPLVLAISLGVLLAGRQARELAAQATGPVAAWQPWGDTSLSLTAQAARRNLRYAIRPTPVDMPVPGAQVSRLDGGRAFELPATAQGTWSIQATAFAGLGRPARATTAVTTRPRVELTLRAPRRLAIGDDVAVPVTILNPTAERLAVVLTAQTESGLDLTSAPIQRLLLPPQSRTDLQVPVRGAEYGRPRLTVKLSGQAVDQTAIGEVEVVPPAPRLARCQSGPLAGTADLAVELPAGATARLLRVSAWPDPLAAWDQSLARSTREPVQSFREAVAHADAQATRWTIWSDAERLTAERRAELWPQLLAAYQQLLRYEVQDRQGRWSGAFAAQPGGLADRWLTVEALRVLQKVDRCTPVDSALLTRSRRWVQRSLSGLARQQPAASGGEQPGGLVSGQAMHLSALALGGALEGSSEVAADRLLGQAHRLTDNLSLAAVAEAAVVTRRPAAVRREVLQRLATMRQQRGDGCHWYPGGTTPLGAAGRGAAIEVTARTVAVLAAAGDSDLRRVARDGARFLATQQTDDGTWGSARLTALAVDALRAAAPPPAGPGHGTLTVTLDGERVGRLAVDPRGASPTQVYSPSPGRHKLALSWSGRGRPSVAVESAWTQSRPVVEPAQMAVRVAFDRPTAPPGDSVTATVEVTNTGERSAAAVTAFLPVPAGYQPRPGGTATVDQDVLEVPLGDLAPGEQAVNTVVLNTPVGTTRITPADAEVRSLYDPGRRTRVRLPRLSTP